MKKLIALLLALAMVFALVSCGNSNATSAKSEESAAPAEEASVSAAASSAPAEDAGEKVLDEVRIGTYASTAFCSSFDISSEYAGAQVGYGTGFLVYDTLFHLGRTGVYETEILDNYEWSDDAITLTMTLKPGITFSNGDDLLMDDVLYSLQHMYNCGFRASYYTHFLDDTAVISDDGLTMSINVDAPYAAFQAGLDFFILDKDYVESVGAENIDWYDPAQVVGSGPYTCTEFVSGVSATYTLRDDYWDADRYLPYVTVVNTNYSDASTMCIDFENGELDVVLNLNVQDYDRLIEIEDDDIDTYLLPGNAVYALTMDANNCEPLKDAKVREAICHAINPEEVSIGAGGSYASPAKSIFSQTELGFIDTSFTYDLDYAKQCMAESGYPDGCELKLSIVSQAPDTTIAEIIQAELAPLNITVTINAVEMVAFINGLMDPSFTDLQVFNVTGGNAAGEPVIDTTNWYSTSSNLVMQREYADEPLYTGAQSLDESVRVAAYQEFQQLVAEHFDAIGLYETYYGMAYNNTVFSEFTVASTNHPYILTEVLA